MMLWSTESQAVFQKIFSNSIFELKHLRKIFYFNKFFYLNSNGFKYL